ncbi:hypothetical protein ON010_g2755 [Phytophthora cinnamomi]|nr:hypothetical protein ON010_g2755 [Phytophthora cinnamomi]
MRLAPDCVSFTRIQHICRERSAEPFADKTGYSSNALDNQRPCNLMVSPSAPESISAVAPPMRIKWIENRAGSSPALHAACLTIFDTSSDVTPPRRIFSAGSSSRVPKKAAALWAQRVALTGQISVSLDL